MITMAITLLVNTSNNIRNGILAPALKFPPINNGLPIHPYFVCQVEAGITYLIDKVANNFEIGKTTTDHWVFTKLAKE